MIFCHFSNIYFNFFLTVNLDILLKLSKVATDWRCYFSDGKQGLLDLVVRLILYLENGVYHVLMMLFETASSPEYDLESVSLNAQEIVGMDSLLPVDLFFVLFY